MSYKKQAEEAIKYFINNNILSNPTIKDIQQYLLEHKINAGKIDGYWGPQTDWAFEAFKLVQKNTKSSTILFRNDTSNDFKYLYKASKFPLYKDIENYFGKLVDIKSNLVTFSVPYTHKLAWNKASKINKVTTHKLVKDAYLNVLETTLKVYGANNISKLHLDVFGGCFSDPPRKMRGGSQWSTHSWGIAFDYDPDNNQLAWGRDKAEFAHPDYKDWSDAWSNNGAFNLGELKNYDWMHYQFCKP